MSDSYSEALLPLKDEDYRSKMTNIHGGLRVSPILEAIDMVGGWISVVHCIDDVIWTDRSQLPMLFATVLVTHAVLLEPIIPADHSVKIKGNVIQAGNTSLVIDLQAMHDGGSGGWKTFLKARHMYVARNWETLGPMKVNQLEPQNEEERRLVESVQGEYE